METDITPSKKIITKAENPLYIFFFIIVIIKIFLPDLIPSIIFILTSITLISEYILLVYLIPFINLDNEVEDYYSEYSEEKKHPYPNYVKVAVISCKLVLSIFVFSIMSILM